MRTKSEWTFDVYLNDEPVRSFKQVASTAKYVATLNSNNIAVVVKHHDQVAHFRTALTDFLPYDEALRRVQTHLNECVRRLAL